MGSVAAWSLERQRRRRAPDAAGAARGIAAIAVGFDRAPRPKTTV